MSILVQQFKSRFEKYTDKSSCIVTITIFKE